MSYSISLLIEKTILVSCLDEEYKCYLFLEIKEFILKKTYFESFILFIFSVTPERVSPYHQNYTQHKINL